MTKKLRHFDEKDFHLAEARSVLLALSAVTTFALAGVELTKDGGSLVVYLSEAILFSTLAAYRFKNPPPSLVYDALDY
jgi:hypothetical protein